MYQIPEKPNMTAALVLNKVPKNLFLRSLKNRKRGGKHKTKDAAIITSFILIVCN